MSEAMLEYRGSYEQALMCVKKAAGYNASYPDWRIFLCRILLENSSSQSNDRGDLPDCEPAEVLAEALQVLKLTTAFLKFSFLILSNLNDVLLVI